MDIDAIYNALDVEIAGINSRKDLEEFRIKYLGRKGILLSLTSSIPTLPATERAAFGKKVNTLKTKLLALAEDKEKSLVETDLQENRPDIDIGLPGLAQELGVRHPIAQVMQEICSIFTAMGFAIVEGPEIETEYNNFTGLNIPLEHPSRDAFDTFYLKTPPGAERLLLRSHTSPVQIRTMKKQKPPLAIIVPGKVYRPDAVDASHSFMFHQIEGFMVDKEIHFSDLKGLLKVFTRAVFSAGGGGDKIKIRFRPHFFPFTEPSAEVDISCIICKGKGCSVCGRKGWLEILGSGMIHPNVLKNVGYNPKIYTGFAFGMGIERIAMLKYGIDDIRLFFDNDIRFLKQF